MVKFRNVVDGTGLNDWWDNDNNQVAFCRGDKGFIAVNGDNVPLNGSFQVIFCYEYKFHILKSNLTGTSTWINFDVSDMPPSRRVL